MLSLGRYAKVQKLKGTSLYNIYPDITTLKIHISTLQLHICNSGSAAYFLKSAMMSTKE